MPITIRTVTAASVFLLATGAAIAQDKFPSKPIRMVVPFPPGAASDFLARTVGQKLGESYGQQIIIDNRPGAGGLMGSAIAATAIPDGYTGGIGRPSSPHQHPDTQGSGLPSVQ